MSVKHGIVRAALGTPVGLCLGCAGDYAAAYALRQVSGEKTLVCESCRKRRLGAEYEIRRKGNGRDNAPPK